MKINIKDINANYTKESERYELFDNTSLNNLTLSKTVLKPYQETRGHSHSGVEEIYHFLEGKAHMIVGEKEYDVEKGDMVLIPDGDFHKVINKSSMPCEFLAIFQAYKRRD